jgi:hypothetical protein
MMLSLSPAPNLGTRAKVCSVRRRLLMIALEQYCPIERSVKMEMFCICAFRILGVWSYCVLNVTSLAEELNF